MVLGKGYVCDVPDRLAGRADARGEIGEGSGVEASEAGVEDVDGFLLLLIAAIIAITGYREGRCLSEMYETQRAGVCASQCKTLNPVMRGSAGTQPAYRLAFLL